MTVYRLVNPRYPANDGYGASLYGGRWNHKGTSVVYAAASRALAALEILANSDALAAAYLVVPIEIPDDLDRTTISIGSLVPAWNLSPPGRSTRDIGSQWAAAMRTAVLVVPSAVLVNENNYILNQKHPDFQKLNFRPAEPFAFDDRLIRAWKM